jgi:hypothetical protein
MDDRIKPTYDLYMEKINAIELEIAERNKQLISYKNIINQLLMDSGEPAKFSDQLSLTELTFQPTSSIPNLPRQGNAINFKISPGEFYGSPLAKSVRIILKRKGEAMLFSDIQNALIIGGADVKDEKRLRLILLKSKHFDLLPDKQHFILVPKEKQKKIKAIDPKPKVDDSEKSA